MKLNADGKIECKVCHEWFATVRAVSTHISKKHGMDLHVYYDSHEKGESEGACAVCGKPTKFRSISDGYAETCSPACRGKVFSINPDRVAKRNAKSAETNLQKYGVANVFQNSEIKAKIRQTNLDNLGVEYPTQSKEVVAKAKATFNERYGSDTYLHSDEGAAVVAATKRTRYGMDNGGGSDDAKLKREATCEAKYGAANPWDNAEFRAAQVDMDRERNGGMHYVQTDEFKRKSAATQEARYGDLAVRTEEFKAKVSATNMERYGTEEYFASDDFRVKAADTNMAKYGVDNYAKTAEYRDRVTATNMERYGAETYSGSPAYRERMLARYREFLDANDCEALEFVDKGNITYRCKLCGNVSTESALFIKWRATHGSTPCTSCVAKNPEMSMEESSLGEFITSLGLTYDHYSSGFLGTYGADMVFEDRKVIIEYDGIYWNSELYRSPGYHLAKTRLAEAQGYHMVHIFSDEWLYRREVVESRLRNLLCPDELKSVYARECEIREVDKDESDMFLDENHIQGACMDSTRLGLYNEGHLVALMTFGHNRFGGGHELIRYCTLQGVRVVGGAGKLFKRYVDDHADVTEITSYADRRWSSANGVFYSKIGFVADGETEPGYFYVNGDVCESRMKYQKHRLVAEGANESKTEHEIMLEREIFRIYDCGNLRYRWTRECK